jgi:hypothetical protein
MRRIAAATVNKNVETKQSISTDTDAVEIFHNNFITLDNAVLQTTQGISDPMNANTSNRIGDEIILRGVKLKGMVELNERYSDVTIRILVVKAAKGDVPTRTTLFTGMSGNKMLDTINKERYTVLAQKYIKLRAPNVGTVGPIDLGPGAVLPSGFYNADSPYQRLSRATKIWKMWLPGSKFKKNRRIVYENGTAQTKFFDYHVLMYAYSNVSTMQDVWYVARSNDYIKQMYYKDA